MIPEWPEPATPGEPRPCQYCGQSFQHPRIQTRFCSIACLIAHDRAQRPLAPEACYQQTVSHATRPEGLLYETDSVIPYTVHRTGPTAHELAQAREQKRLQTLFSSAAQHEALGLWQDDLGLSIRLTGPYPAAAIETAPNTSHKRFIVYWQGQYRIVSVPGAAQPGRMALGEWCLYDPDASGRRHEHRYQLGVPNVATEPELPDDIKALRRIIQKNHPDKGGRRVLYEAAKRKLDELRGSTNPPRPPFFKGGGF